MQSRLRLPRLNAYLLAGQGLGDEKYLAVAARQSVAAVDEFFDRKLKLL
jgi:hypothetical protein